MKGAKTASMVKAFKRSNQPGILGPNYFDYVMKKIVLSENNLERKSKQNSITIFFYRAICSKI